MKAQRITPAVLALALFACGGGGGGGASPALGGSSSSNASSVATSSSSSASSGASNQSSSAIAYVPGVSGSGQQIGYYLDGAVKGMSYKTLSRSGTTDDNGMYVFMPGEEVEFGIYGTTLKKSMGSRVLTPADGHDVNVDYTLNILRFLQTVDTDNNPGNGITLPSVSNPELWRINFDQHFSSFEKDQTVLEFLNAYASGRSLVSLNAAIKHFNETMKKVSDAIVLDLTPKNGKRYVVDMEMRGDSCNNEVFPKIRFSFYEDKISMFGHRSIGWTSETADANGKIECVAAKHIDDSYDYADVPSDTYKNGPIYTYSMLNKMYTYSSANSNGSVSQYVALIWHTPGDDKIIQSTRIYSTTAVYPHPQWWLSGMTSVAKISLVENSSSSSSSIASSASSASSPAASSASASTSASASSASPV